MADTVSSLRSRRGSAKVGDADHHIYGDIMGQVETGQIRKILLVDDEESILGITSAMLERIADKHGLDFDIKTSSDAVHVLYDLVHQQKDDFDLIFMDVRMPRVCGEEIYRSMQLMDSKGQDRVVFVTAYPDDLVDAIFGVPLKILKKPFHLRDVEKIVLRIFDLDDGSGDEPWETLENKPC